jgi:hypothetical protein
MNSRFCEELKWAALKTIISDFASQFTCMHKNLQRLINIPGMSLENAQALFERSYTCAEDILAANIDDVAQALQLSASFSFESRRDDKSTLPGYRRAASKLKEVASKHIEDSTSR